MTATESAKQRKRIIFITGDKGGVGKSFMARTLLQYYIDSKIACRAFDIDPVNPCLHQYYPNHTERIDISDLHNLDPINDAIENNSLILVDCAARSIHDLNTWFKEVDIMAERQSLDFALTFVFVITPDKSCMAIMTDALEMFGRDGDYLIVKNSARGKDFSIYENSKIKKRMMEEAAAKEIVLPTLAERTVILMDRHDIAFRDAIHHSMATLSNRSRVHAYLRTAYAQFETVKEMLGV